MKSIIGKAVPKPELSKPELTLIEKLEALIEGELRDLALENDKLGRYPTKSMALLRSTGVFKASLPEPLGGLGYSHSFSLECQFRLAMADGAVAQLYKVHDELVREIFEYCPEFQKERLADLIVNHDQVVGLAVAEPNRSAVDPMKTSAVEREDKSFEINGFKIYTTAAAEADQIATWAWNADAYTEDNPLAAMQLFLIPKGTQGVKINRDWDALGQRATDSGSINFDNVKCRPEWLASVPGKAPLIHSSVRYQAGFSAILVGLGFGALRAAIPYINERSRPWAATGVEHAVEDPYIKKNIGEQLANLTAAYALVQRCGRLLDQFEAGEIDRAELALPISAAKVAANQASLNACGSIHGLMGAGSVMQKFRFDYWWRNARTLSLHDPVDWKMHELGRHALTGWEPEPGVYQ